MLEAPPGVRAWRGVEPVHPRLTRLDRADPPQPRGLGARPRVPGDARAELVVLAARRRQLGGVDAERVRYLPHAGGQRKRARVQSQPYAAALRAPLSVADGSAAQPESTAA